MIGRAAKWMSLALLIWYALFGSVVGVLSYSGLCPERGSFLSDQDAIDAVVQTLVLDRRFATVTVTEDGEMSLDYVSPIPFESATQFHRLNPDCCRAYSLWFGDGRYTDFWDRVFGRAARHVWVQYTVLYQAEDGVRRAMQPPEVFVVTNCGGWVYGGWSPSNFEPD
jgi:hypothetical protein